MPTAAAFPVQLFSLRMVHASTQSLAEHVIRHLDVMQSNFRPTTKLGRGGNTMTLQSLLIAMCLCSLAPMAAAQDLMCSSEIAAGLVYDKFSKTWRAGTLTTDAKYLVTKSTNPNARLEVRQFGKKTAVAFCKDVFSQNGLLHCVGFWQDFYFNRTDLRFIHTYFAGYWNEKESQSFAPNRKEGDDTPGVVGGTCVSL